LPKQTTAPERREAQTERDCLLSSAHTESHPDTVNNRTMGRDDNRGRVKTSNPNSALDRFSDGAVDPASAYTGLPSFRGAISEDP
jgi:hypothetical protein